MSKLTGTLSDAQLDTSLDLLKPPAPSDTLRLRVQAMAPGRDQLSGGRRFAVAAAIVATVAAAALFQLSPAPTDVPDIPVATVSDPAGEIPLPALALTDEEPTAGTLPTEPFSIASMPLE